VPHLARRSCWTEPHSEHASSTAQHTQRTRLRPRETALRRRNTHCDFPITVLALLTLLTLILTPTTTQAAETAAVVRIARTPTEDLATAATNTAPQPSDARTTLIHDLTTELTTHYTDVMFSDDVAARLRIEPLEHDAAWEQHQLDARQLDALRGAADAYLDASEDNRAARGDARAMWASR